MQYPQTPKDRQSTDLGQWIVDTITDTLPIKEAKTKYSVLRYWDPALPDPRGEVQDPLYLFSEETQPDDEHTRVVPRAASEFISTYRAQYDEAHFKRLARLLDPDTPDDKLTPMTPEKFPLGLVDEPEQQRRRPLIVDLLGDPNVANSGGPLLIVGAQGFGKRTALRTLALWMALRFAPGQVHCAVLDFAGSLQDYKHLDCFKAPAGTPLTSLYTNGENLDELKGVVQTFTDLIERQQEVLQGALQDAPGMTYRTLPIPLPLYLLIVTQYGDLASDVSGKKAETTKVLLSASGLRRCGVSAIVTTTTLWRASDTTMLDIANFKNRIVLATDDNTRSTLLPRQFAKQSDDIEGRGYALIPRQKPRVVQLALPVPGVGEEDQDANFRDLLGLIPSSPHGGRP